jgi:hypothetical protein
MVDEPKPKAAKMKKRRRAPPEAFITYVVGIVGWDWGYARKKRGGHGRTTKLRGAKLVPGRRCTCMQSVERARESCFPVDTKPQSAHRRGSARTPTGEPMSGLLSPRLISSTKFGKDGQTAISSDKPLSADYMFARVDAMPMRRDEMRRAR